MNAGAGTLFVVATPIGNLDDLTRRAERTLASAARVVAEDTRRTRALLGHLGIAGKQVDRLDAHATARDVGRVVEALASGEDVALVTDAGTPGVSDPGAALVTAAIEAGITVVPIPGASAPLAALSAAGFPQSTFRFAAFLPRSGTARADAISAMLESQDVQVFFESPRRLAETLAELAKLAPERPAVVARELTKVHEELVRGTLTELAADEREWLGEITVVLGPAPARDDVASDADVDAWIDAGLAEGTRASDVARIVAARSGRPKREIYARVLSRAPRLRRRVCWSPMFGFFRKRRRLAKRQEPFPDAWRRIALANVRELERLSPEDQRELFGHVLVFLAEKQFEGAGGLAITDEIRVTIAVQACMLLLHRDTDYYPDLSTIVVYPSAFRVPVRKVDAAGIVTEEKQVRLGESWHRGPVIIAWDAALRGGRNPDDGHNLVMHEFAHQLDSEDGAPDGAPVLDDAPTSYRTWGRVLGKGYRDLRFATDHHRKTVMDAYGATDPAEFFAVLTETFFEKPARLKAEQPDLYEQMVAYYRQDPATWHAPHAPHHDKKRG